MNAETTRRNRPECSGDPRTLLIDIPSSLEAPAIARRAVNSLAADNERASHFLYTLALLISEVVTNAVVHPRAPGGDPIALSITMSHERSRVEVSDRGKGFARRTDSPAAGREGGGYGLMLLDTAASRWGTDASEGRFTVWFEVDHVGDEPFAERSN
jgi:anti-sigma regulatory factor (Ser/Thr protein kinase)